MTKHNSAKVLKNDESVESKPSWVTDSVEKYRKTEEFEEIYDFYKIHTLHDSSSARGKKFKDYNWNNSKLLQEAIFHKLKLEGHFFYSNKGYTGMPEGLIKLGLDSGNWYKGMIEKVCFSRTRPNGELNGLLVHLRNSFAHERFQITEYKENNDWIFIFEDIGENKTTKKIEISSRMILKKSTLQKWMNIIKHGEDDYKNRQSGNK